MLGLLPPPARLRSSSRLLASQQPSLGCYSHLGSEAAAKKRLRKLKTARGKKRLHHHSLGISSVRYIPREENTTRRKRRQEGRKEKKKKTKSQIVFP